MTNDRTEQIYCNLELTKSRISKAAKKTNRDPDAVHLVVVTKGQPLTIVQSAIQAGAKILGENYAEEAIEKKLAMNADSSIEWHMIGHIQSRKAEMVAGNFRMIHSLDSLKLAARLEQNLKKSGITIPALLEFNVGGEENKYGWLAKDSGSWSKLLPDLEQILGFPHLKITGLMTMPPYNDDPERSRSYFIALRKLREYISMQLGLELKDLSIGTSNDFEIAVEEGATFVRIGEAIVGKRHKLLGEQK